MKKPAEFRSSPVANLSDYLRLQATDFPEKLAVLHPISISFGDLDRKVDQLCHGLSDKGFKKGTRTLMLVKANLDFYILTFALLRIGCVPVFIDPGVGRRVMRDSLAGVDADAFIGNPLAHLFRLLYQRKFRNIRQMVTVGPRWFWGGCRYRSLFVPGRPAFCAESISREDTGGIFFTSGSTGPPKGVVYHNGIFHAQIQYFKTYYHWTPDEIDLCTFPLIGLFSLCLGVSIVLADMDPSKPSSLDPGKIWSNLIRYRCSHMFCSPMILRKLVEYKGKEQTSENSLRRIVTAGAPVPMSLLREVNALLNKDTEIHIPYGATEALPVTDAAFAELKVLPGSDDFQSGICVGRPLPGMNLEIIEISQKPIPVMNPGIHLPIGSIGEIAVNGPVVSETYLKNPLADEMSKMRDDSGGIWHRMGDVGRLDNEGRLWFYGRKNHRVETGEGCLYTIPVEAFFNSHPKVLRTALVGIQSVLAGCETPVVCVLVTRFNYWFKRRKIRKELINMAGLHPGFSGIKLFLFRCSFPMDPRHNAKIFREKLKIWASRKIIRKF